MKIVMVFINYCGNSSNSLAVFFSQKNLPAGVLPWSGSAPCGTIRTGRSGNAPIEPSGVWATTDEFAAMVAHVIENSMLNGETIRLDGAIRMAPK